MSALSTDVGETAFPLELTVNQYGVGGVTGLAPTVAIRNTATGFYLDWSNNIFLNSGWVTKYQIMSEIERGHYQQILNISALALPVGTKLAAEYFVNNGGTVIGSAEDVIFVNNVASQVTFLRKIAKNRSELTSGATGLLKLYDDDGATVLETWGITDESGGAILPTVGSPAKRGAGSP